jgi:hypothetical protein
MTYDDEAICLCDAYRADLRPGLCPIHSVSTVERNVMPTYTVIATVEGEEIVSIIYGSHVSALDMMSSVGNALRHDEPDATPFSVRTLSVTITVNYPEA